MLFVIQAILYICQEGKGNEKEPLQAHGKEHRRMGLDRIVPPVCFQQQEPPQVAPRTSPQIAQSNQPIL